ncbi:protein kinase family protein [Wolbachia endosymbiont of Wuchereria bancrofti]|uniref:acetyltransferase n=1 Tax=Wolbachia endosymbiont of Wuchereria bancrofti TaxID=96496 RepID=UPI0003452968|nr:acetyltransferase [Wolbachia endosymbiont of Wuchereria bancrofti]OWZ25697.1 putative acetyltransferase [Wolbachia endosymbiont of Wuchereria bancrofti]
MISKTGSRLEITLSLIAKLVAQQFSKWAYLEVKPVELSRIDNRTFRLCEEILIRATGLPSAENCALRVLKEQKWLKILAPHLSFSVPALLEMGQPSKHYP